MLLATGSGRGSSNLAEVGIIVTVFVEFSLEVASASLGTVTGPGLRLL